MFFNSSKIEHAFVEPPPNVFKCVMGFYIFIRRATCVDPYRWMYKDEVDFYFKCN
jgi:hypothetical protein